MRKKTSAAIVVTVAVVVVIGAIIAQGYIDQPAKQEFDRWQIAARLQERVHLIPGARDISFDPSGVDGSTLSIGGTSNVTDGCNEHLITTLLEAAPFREQVAAGRFAAIDCGGGRHSVSRVGRW